VTPYTNDLKQQIERILRWEQSSHWRLRDFVQLSERVLAHTNCWVEPHDLQTFWRSSETTPALLDALAQFADYIDWTDFCSRNQMSEMVPVKPNAFHAPNWEISKRWVIILCWLSVLAALLVGALLVWKQ
jgi:hypothetical protein